MPEFESIKNRSLLVDEPANTFLDLKLGGELIVPSSLEDFLQNPIGVVRRSSRFVIAQEDNLTISGFRGCMTQDNRFYIDESVVDGFNYSRFLAKLSSGQDEEMLQRDGEFVLEREKIVVEEPVISLASDEPTNFGSWLYRFVPKLVTADFRRYPVFSYQSAGWMREMFRLFFGDNLRIVPHWPTKNYLLKRALVPSQRNVDVLFDLSSAYFYRDVAARVAGYSDKSKVYLSRRRQSLRPLRNEAELEQRLIEVGFTVICPETLPLEEQIRTLRDARVIVCPGGAGLFLSVFATSAEVIVDLEPSTEWLYAHHNLLRSLGKRHAVVFGKKETSDQIHAPWSVNVEHVFKALRHAGVC